ncbi:ComF family protein [Carboxylicivirga sp. A043]|uniref:ComF family protein n=1 Tax=Carboxylicivirga litoralis TaxID=2816963 RepID=UPI0021CB6D50|nr:phosphoribosyltransferase family protein [Carboxylicivirga sp. A043]MCU4155188.1 ComF family protein [Carboxylicivirga sp. A043]
MSLTKKLTEVISATGELFFPPICISCGTHLFKNEVEICQMCIRRLPRTHFENRPHDNQISIMMWGRCKIELAFVLFFYRKGERVQYLLHEIKYRGNQLLGEELGRQLGVSIKKSDVCEFDFIVPIPLHPKKLAKRGYNQAEVIAKGISEILKVPLDVDSVIRNIHTSSQTRKGRFERWQNVEEIFKMTDMERLKNKHILLIDDVITTGSTMEACINQLTTIEGLKVSVASIACAAL